MSRDRPRGSYTVEVSIGGLKGYRHAGLRSAGWRGRRFRRSVNSRSVVCPNPRCGRAYLSVVRVLFVGADRLRKRPLPYAVGYWCPVCFSLFDPSVGTGFNGRSMSSFSYCRKCQDSHSELGAAKVS